MTLEDVQKVGRPFERGVSNKKPFEELVLTIERKLRSLIGKSKEHEKHERYKDIATLVKILTRDRTVSQASDYLQLEEGANWRKCSWWVTIVL